MGVSISEMLLSIIVLANLELINRTNLMEILWLMFSALLRVLQVCIPHQYTLGILTLYFFIFKIVDYILRTDLCIVASDLTLHHSS